MLSMDITFSNQDLKSSSVAYGSKEATTQVLAKMSADKWNAIQQLCGFSLAMFVGAFGSGMLPSSISMNQRQLKIFNCIGAGMLLGTGLSVIIPEGVHSMYEQDEAHDEHSHHSENSEGSMSEHSLIGWSLVLGFMFMLLVDNLTCCGGMHHHSHSTSSRDCDFDRDHTHSSQSEGPESEVPAPNASQKFIKATAVDSRSTTRRRTTVTIGLIIHSIADGIALGAAQSISSNTSLEGLLFVAIMMHKVPAAFGLAVYLKSSGLGTVEIRRNLFIFAMAAPIGAFATFLSLHDDFFALASMNPSAVSCCLLFSGGTFLYVSAVHILGELKNSNRRLSTKELVSLCCGCLVPGILFSGHDHGH